MSKCNRVSAETRESRLQVRPGPSRSSTNCCAKGAVLLHDPNYESDIDASLCSTESKESSIVSRLTHRQSCSLTSRLAVEQVCHSTLDVLLPSLLVLICCRAPSLRCSRAFPFSLATPHDLRILVGALNSLDVSPFVPRCPQARLTSCATRERERESRDQPRSCLDVPQRHEREREDDETDLVSRPCNGPCADDTSSTTCLSLGCWREDPRRGGTGVSDCVKPPLNFSLHRMARERERTGRLTG